jgi:hypothetical protein
MRILAVDWSGKRTRPEEFIWVAEVRDGEPTDLRNGLSREQVVERLATAGAEEPRTVVGLDFAFSFPAWWCREQGWEDVGAVWAAMARDGERLLDACADPLWGRPGTRNPATPERPAYRRTDRAAGPGSPKSVFQIGGAGAVGTGSVRGMPHLRTLRERGFAVWPFHDDGPPWVVELYPRALTDVVNKSSWRDRRAYLARRFPEQPDALLERAAGSEDAFDGAVSALVMDRHREELATLGRTSDPVEAIEGRIWRPGTSARASARKGARRPGPRAAAP